MQVSVEAGLEQPFFVHGCGWSSCDPARTLARYQLTCRQLSVGDTCISLTADDFDGAAAAAAAAAGRQCCHLPPASRAPLDNSRSTSLATYRLHSGCSDAVQLPQNHHHHHQFIKTTCQTHVLT